GAVRLPRPEPPLGARYRWLFGRGWTKRSGRQKQKEGEPPNREAANNLTDLERICLIHPQFYIKSKISNILLRSSVEVNGIFISPLFLSFALSDTLLPKWDANFCCNLPSSYFLTGTWRDLGAALSSGALFNSLTKASTFLTLSSSSTVRL